MFFFNRLDDLLFDSSLVRKSSHGRELREFILWGVFLFVWGVCGEKCCSLFIEISKVIYDTTSLLDSETLNSL